MAIQYYPIPERRQMIAVLNGTEYDAVYKINKMMKDTYFCVCSDKYLMPRSFKTIVQCDERDEFNEEEGKKIAKKRIMDKYHKSFDKKIAKFREDLLMLNGKCFESVDIQ